MRPSLLTSPNVRNRSAEVTRLRPNHVQTASPLAEDDRPWAGQHYTMLDVSPA